MTLERYWAILVKQWGLVVICFVGIGLGAYIGSRLMTPLYQSTALVQVTINSGNNQSSYDNLLASDQLVQTEAALAVSDPVLRDVVTRYPGLTLQQLMSETTSTSKLDTQLFEIDVLDSSPTRAAALANDIATTLIKQQLQLDQQNNLQSQQQLQQDLGRTSGQIDSITNQIATLQINGGNQVKIGTLKTRLNNLTQHYGQVQTALAQLELAQAQQSSYLRVVQRAQPASLPLRPNKLLNTGAGLLAGLLLGMLLAALLELLDVRVRTPEALTQLLSWPVLTTILRVKREEKVINPVGRNTNVEPYRILRSNIGFSSIDNPIHTLVVTSAMPQDGKSAVAANLAIFMARAGKSTILVDADLRRPVQHEQFDLPAHSKGFSNAILASSESNTELLPAYKRSSPPTSPIAPAISLDPFIHSAGIPNLSVMPSGPLPPNPPELLDSKAMRHLLQAFSDYGTEVVIFDTPPLLGLSDARILASKADGTIVVVDITRVHKKYLKQMKTVLEQAGAHVLGCVINKQRRRGNDTLSYYYYTRANEPKRKGKRSKKGAGAVLPAAPDTPRPSNVFSQQNSDDVTMKLTPIPPTQEQCSQIDISSMNTTQTPSISSASSIQQEKTSKPVPFDRSK
jgi:Mrp family chromosome partitioning ATPase